MFLNIKYLHLKIGKYLFERLEDEVEKNVKIFKITGVYYKRKCKKIFFITSSCNLVFGIKKLTKVRSFF